MIEFKVLRPERHPTYQIRCKCGAMNVRAQIACIDLRPFVCWNCLAMLPNIMTMYKHIAYRIDYHRGGMMPPLISGLY